MAERLTATQARALIAKQTEPESVVIAQVRSYLATLGWYVIRIQQGFGCHKGVSDLICCKDGRVVFVETKATKGKLSANQILFQFEIERAGGTYWCVHSLTELCELLRGER